MLEDYEQQRIGAKHGAIPHSAKRPGTCKESMMTMAEAPFEA